MKRLEFTKSTRSYATFDGAVNALKKLPEMDATVVIHSDGQRFSPFFVLRGESTALAAALAGRGFHVTI